VDRAELIQTYGGKGGIIKGLLEERVDVNIPPTAFLFAGESPTRVKEEFRSFRKPVIVRGSHPGDYAGLVGIVPTVKDVYDWKQFLAAVDKVRDIEDDIRARKYARDEGTELVGMNVVLQEQQTDLHYRAIVLRHPNQPELVILNYCNAKEPKGGLFRMSSWQGERIQNGVGEGTLSEETIDSIVAMQTRIENANIIDKSFAHQIEFGFGSKLRHDSSVVFYQARPFKPFRSADFCVTSGLLLGSVYGITPPEGITLPVVRVSYFDPMNPPDEDFVLMTQENIKEDEVPLDISLKRMKVFIEPTHHAPLGHGSYRYHQRAEVSLSWSRMDMCESWGEERLHIISDGERFTIDTA